MVDRIDGTGDKAWDECDPAKYHQIIAGLLDVTQAPIPPIKNKADCGKNGANWNVYGRRMKYDITVVHQITSFGATRRYNTTSY
jgi:hypothetical protein